mgnify:CR=1 FL=1
MMAEKYDVFISHASKDRDWVKNLVAALSDRGLCVWYDETNIKFGDSILRGIEEGLRESKYIVILLTPDTVSSNWAAAELGAALAMKKVLIPIVSEDMQLKDLPGPVRSRRFLRKGDPNSIAEEIAEGIFSIHQKDKPGKMKSVLSDASSSPHPCS